MAQRQAAARAGSSTGPSATSPADRPRPRVTVGATDDPETRAAVEDVARLLEDLGHHVEPSDPPIPDTFAHDFSHYWALLGFLANLTGRLTYDRSFDASRTEPLTRALARMFRRDWKDTPGMLWRLRRSQAAYRAAFSDLDLYLSPVLSHTTPVLGHLAADQPGEELFDRLQSYVGFTPLNNATGSPAMSLPLARTQHRPASRRALLGRRRRRADPARARLRAGGGAAVRPHPGRHDGQDHHSRPCVTPWRGVATAELT